METVEETVTSNPIASIDALVHATMVGEQLVSYCGEQHIITFRMGFGVLGLPASYSFLDLQTWPSSPSNATCWRLDRPQCSLDSSRHSSNAGSRSRITRIVSSDSTDNVEPCMPGGEVRS